jgi:hypothetical protein
MNRYEHLSAGTPFRSNEELLLFVDARLAGNDNPELLASFRDPNRAWRRDMMTRGRRLPGSGWSNIRRH